MVNQSRHCLLVQQSLGHRRAKGYAGKLNKQDKARFAWSVISSIKAAVKAKRLIKRADGRLVASAALQAGR